MSFEALKMFCSRRVLQQWCFALFLLCSPVPHFGRPIDALSSRMSFWTKSTRPRSASSRSGPPVEASGGGSSSGAGVGLPAVGLPAVGLGINLSTTGSTLHSKPPGGTKNLPISFRLEEEEGTNLPQETNKSQTYKEGMKAPGKKKKKGRSGKRREGEKRKRRARSLGWRLEDEPGSGLHLEWRSVGVDS
ncbi:hypothetical protein L3Q82_009214 [Scortum barcoo]|uniref:Uncharacterized protein n=1 Tax=Scortum barcoo TaxID=214431 RepID=A0ACB8WFQ7_9TELE|nr:hypothetical protein L3Q82_009214 [Scortum barcoo]